MAISSCVQVFLCVGGEGPAVDASVVVTGDEHCALMVFPTSLLLSSLALIDTKVYEP